MNIAPIWTPVAVDAANVVRAPGRFDIHEVDAVEELIAAASSLDGTPAVLDCSDVEFIDAAAVDALLADRDRPLGFLAPSPAMRITLELLGHEMAIEQVAA